ncbi:MAG: glycosyltransferase [Pseudomonadota bacterium]
MNQNSKIKVSVCVVTYNQENYIRDCLESIVNQSTNFNFEVIVSDDCSTDRTAEIIQEYADKYAFVRPILRRVNVGAGANYFNVHKLAIGEYISHCDGDDLFLPGKLQKQADLLDEKPLISMTAHAVKVIGSQEVIGAAPNLPVIGSVEQLVSLGTYFVHSSVMYRYKCRKKYPEGFDAVDFYVYIDTAINGPIYLDKSVLGCYRKHGGGVSSNPAYKSIIEAYYLDAYNLALSLGIDKTIVKKAQVHKKLTFSLSLCFVGDLSGFKRQVELSSEEYKYATWSHKLLHLTRHFPLIFCVLYLIKKIKK